MPKPCKILILGKTGVGKSALLNYMAGETLAESGIAHMAGGITKGIDRYSFKINGYECSVSDSEGLETGDNDYERWDKIIKDELKKTNSSMSIYEWYHVVIFCISAGSGRVEPCEINIIKQLIDANYGVIIAFTKADQSSEEDTQKLRNTIENDLLALHQQSCIQFTSCNDVVANYIVVNCLHNADIKEKRDFKSHIKYIDVCSVDKKMNRFGKDELSEAIINQWRRTLTNRLPEHIFGWTYDYLDEKKQSIKSWVWNQKMGTFGRETENVARDVNEMIKNAVESVSKTLQAKYKEAMESINILTGIFSNMLPEVSSRISEILKPFIIKEKDSSQELGTVGTAVATALGVGFCFVFPIIIPAAFVAAIFDKGKKDKRKLCEAVDEKFVEFANLIKKQQMEFKNNLNKAYGGIGCI